MIIRYFHDGENITQYMNAGRVNIVIDILILVLR